jgi:hypothetical protein
MKKILVVLGLVLFSSGLFAEPEWFYQPPKASGFYYFAGVGKGASRGAAKNAALADIFSQIVYMINASVTSNSTFEQYVEENEQEARRNSSVYKKVKAKGEAVIEKFELDKQHSEKEKEDGKTKNVFYVLAKVPKSEIEKAKERIEAEKAKKRENPMGVFSLAVFPNKNVVEVDTIKSQLEEVYRNMGFNIKSMPLEIPADAAGSSGKLVQYLKKNAYPQITRALVCVIKPSGVRKEKLGKFDITSILGDMIIREINLKTGEILSTNTLDAKGVSMRKGNSAVEDAFRKLIKNLTEELLEDPTGSGGEKEDSYF